jgi:ketosteroid isomerase-like protein
MKRVVGLGAWLCAGVLSAQSVEGMFAQGAIGAMLDSWHAAAAEANEAKYFSYFTTDAVFLGTDPTERWTRDEFRQWAQPHFAKGRAWKFRAVARYISFAPDRTVAWFDEALDTENMGRCRGSGVLVRVGDTWKIAQYNLSIPIPNDLTDQFVKRIREEEKAR